MARNNGILVNDFRKMVLDGHINEVIKALRYDEHDLVAQINKTLKIPSVKSNSREETFHTIFTNNVLSCPIDFVSITVTARQYPLNTVIYTFDVMYYNDAINNMGIDMSDYCNHKITISSVGLYTRKFSNWVMDVANDIRESMISAWKFAGNHAPDFIAAFDEVLDERKAEGIDINGLYGADIPANDTEGDTSDATTKDTKDSDDVGMKIITVKNLKDANKIIKTVTDFVKDFRKDPTSTADDLMDKISSFLDAEAIEHTIRDIEQENATDDDGIQDEQSDPNREPEPDDDIHEPVEEEFDEEDCDDECCDCCDRCMNSYNLYSINTAEHFTSILDRAFSSQLLNNIQNYMVRNKLTKYEVELIPNSVNITATSKVVLTMNRFYFNYKKLDSGIGGSVSIGVYNREKNTCYYKFNCDFEHVTLNDIKTIYVDNLTDMSIPQREEQIFHAIIDYIYNNFNYSTIFFAVAYAEGWDVNDPDFEFDFDLIDGIDRHFYDSIHGSVFADYASVAIDNPDNTYMDPGFSEFYNSLDERTLNAYGTDDDWYEDDDDEDDEDADYDDIMSETNGYFMTDIDSKED